MTVFYVAFSLFFLGAIGSTYNARSHSCQGESIKNVEVKFSDGTICRIFACNKHGGNEMSKSEKKEYKKEESKPKMKDKVKDAVRKAKR